MRSRLARGALIAFAGVGSVALAGLAFFRVELAGGIHLAPRFDLGDWARQLPSHIRWVLPFMVLTATLSPLRAVVWSQTLPRGPGLPAVPFRKRFYACAVGALVHNALPGHLGVFASAWLLSRTGGPALPASLASLLLAKLLEFGALLTTTALWALIARMSGVGGLTVGPMLWTGLVALAVFVVAMGSARRLFPRLAARLDRRGRLPRLASALHALAGGLAAVGSLRRLALGAALALGPVFASALAFAQALRPLGAHSYFLGGGLMVGAVAFTQMIPGLPSSMGLYYIVIAATARSLGVADEPAAALAALAHAASIATHVTVGLITALTHREGLRDIWRIGQAARRASPPA